MEPPPLEATSSADELRPLLAQPVWHQPQAEWDQTDASGGVVEFDEGDPDNPLEWSQGFKWSMVALLASLSFTVTFTCISVIPLASDIAHDLHDGQGSKTTGVLLVTIWELGEAAGPLLMAPLSEMLGRYPVLNLGNVMLITGTVLAARSRDATHFIAARGLSGLGVATNVLSPAIVGDLFPPEQRGTAMGFILLAQLIGGAVAPAMAGAVAQTVGWRWVLWLSVGMEATCELVFLLCFRETYKMVILGRRASSVRLETAIKRRQTSGLGSSRLWRKLWALVKRPAVLLGGSGVLVAVCACGSVLFALFYVNAVVLPDVLENVYDLSPTLKGTAFLSFSIGNFSAFLICNRYLDSIYTRLRDANDGVHQPEYRLPLAVVGAVAAPLCLAMFGCFAQLAFPLPLLLLSNAMLGATFILASLPLTAYVVDAFGLYSASALTGLIISRCVVSTFLPLTVPPLLDNFGYGWGLGVLSGLCLVLAPLPWFVFRYGSMWRQSSSYTRDSS